MNTRTEERTEGGFGDIVETILNEAPEPQPNAINEAVRDLEIENVDGAPAPESVLTSAISGDLDDSGTAWNPEIHATGADGKGVKTAKGLWRQRRGRGTRSVIAASAGSAVPPRGVAESRAAGAAAAHAMFAMGRMIGGEEWQPIVNAEKNEVQIMEEAYANYFVAKNWQDFPPGMALTMAIAGYMLPRFTMPKTQSRLVRFKAWTAGKFVAWRERRKQRDNTRATREL